MYYAMSDSFTSDMPAEHTAGFANTKEPIAFSTIKERTAWIKETKLITARTLRYEEALKYSIRANGNETAKNGNVQAGDRIVRVAFSDDYYIIKKF